MLSRFDIAEMTAAPTGVSVAACAACKTMMMIMTDPPGPERRRAS